MTSSETASFEINAILGGEGGDRGNVVVKALCYKLKGRGFGSR
jgi:hypothetical protein